MRVSSSRGFWCVIGMVAFCLVFSGGAFASCTTPANPIEAENCKPGNPDTEWDINGAGDPTIQGFATDISYNLGATATFKIKTDAPAYTIDIYRMGYYSGMGARKVASVSPSATLPQLQPDCLIDTSVGLGGSGLADCGNWAVSASWAIPANATSGIYFALLTRTDTGGQSHIFFIVRDDGSHSDLLFQTSDTTWQAYNNYAGGSLYGAATLDLSSRSFKVSYNRPFVTRQSQAHNWVFDTEYPMVRWLEANGYNVSYFSGVDTARFAGRLLQHKVFLSVGHDEYWSGDQRANVEAARAAGVNLAFFSGNEVFWKTRWENSIDGSGTAYRTLVAYKETHANAKIDPLANVWTGTWRDPRFSPPADGGRPENSLTGTLFTVNGASFGSIQIPAADGKMRFWRNTSVANQSAGQVATLPDGTLGYEWDTDADNGARPPGLIHLSTATYDITGLYLLDFGSTYGNGTATHHLTLYRAPSGALVFGAGTIRWSWGLDSEHDTPLSSTFSPDARMQQATVNLFADMGAQPATLQAGLVPATQSTDTITPSSSIISPASGTTVQVGTVVNLAGTAVDQGGVVGAVEVSLDGGATWHAASGRESWSYAWTTNGAGTFTMLSRAADDSGNLETPSAGITVTVTCPCSVMNSATVPTVVDSGDAQGVEVGVKFRSDVNGFITGIRFYKGATNTGTHVGHLWTSDGTLLASATFTGETASRWQQVTFPAAVAINAGTTYVASYHAPNGHYSVGVDYFAFSGVDSPPLHLLKNGVDGGNGVFSYGPSGTFPLSSFRSSNYYVDVILVTGTVTSVSPASGAFAVPITTPVSATFEKALNPASVTGSSFQLLDPANNPVAASVAYDANTRTATVTPSSALDAATTYTAFISGTTGGITDSSGNPLGLNLLWRFTTCCSIWSSAVTPGVVDSGDAAAVEVGVKFRSDVNGFITGLRFYKSAANTGTHVGHLWTKDGTLLSSATFTSETASGWQQVNFPTAIAITAGTTYVASYFAPVGRYSVGLDYFAVNGVDTAPLHALKQGVDGGNGVFSYGPNGTFPVSSFRSSNYWVDVVFTTNVGGLAGPTITSLVPGSGALGVSVAATVNAGFNKALDPATVNTSTFQVIDVTGDIVPALVSYNPDTFTATLAPIFGFDFTNSYRAVVTGGTAGVKDTLGHPMTVSVLWPFATEPAPAGSCPCSVFGSTTTPPVADSGETTPFEVGVKFRSTVNGFVTGLRFYKSAANTGTHVGHLWTRDGKLLSSATFTSETASGWQQVNFPTAIAITAGTTYVASYFAPNGHYAVSLDHFASAGMNVPPLHFLKDGEDGGNGIFSSGASGTFPTSTFRSSNYWVDVVFATSVAGVFGPTVTTVSPSSAATGVNISTAIHATFDRDLDPGSVNGGTFQLLDSTNNPVNAAVTYDADTRTATLTPSSDLNLASSYRPLVVGRTAGVKDAAGHPMRSSVVWLFTTAPTPSGSCPCSLWAPSALPTSVDSADPAAIEVGVRFRSDVNGFISGIRFYKGATNTGTHTGHLWTNDGTLIASATFTNETASGWQQVNFPTAVAINAGTTYVASYFAPNGHYSLNDLQFEAAGVDNPPLHLLRDGLDGPNGVFDYSATSKFPTSTFRSSNYWVDVVFDTGVPRPVVASTIPANGETGVNPATTVTAVFATPMDPATINSSTFLLLDQFNAVVTASVTYDSATKTAVLTPAAPLEGTASYRAVLKGGTTDPRVKDLNGNSLVTDYSWTFGTASQLLSLTLDTAAVQGGTSLNGTVTLRTAASGPGVTIQLSSSNTGAASVPPTVTVPAGATSATVVVSTTPVATATPVTITATHDIAKSAQVTVNAPAVSGLSLTPTTVIGGTASTGTVTVNSPAPAGGIAVALASDNAAATVPASVIVPAGTTTGTFNVTTTAVPAGTSATITATLNGVRTATLVISSGSISTLTLSPTSVVGGNSSTGTVTLSGAAPPGGATIALSDTNPAATVPANVFVAAGATSATFNVTTSGVSANTAGAISATYLGVTKTASLTVTPASLTSLALSPATVVGPASSTATVTLNGNAPPGGALVTLSDANAAASVPASVTVAEGARTATFIVSTVAVASTTTGNVTGNYRGTNRSANLTVNPLFASLSLNPSTVIGGASSTATITLNAAAPAGGVVFTLTDANPAATVPPSVTVPGGATTTTFTVTTVPVNSSTTGAISASDGITTRSANLTISPSGLSSIGRTPSAVVGGNPITGTATLNGAAGPAGVVVTLSTNNPAVVIPATVTVAPGATSATFTINTVTVTAVTTGTVSGTYLGVTRTSGVITINPPALTSLTLSPTALAGGNQSIGTVTLTGNAAVDVTVTLSSNNAIATVPASVVVPAGSRTATFIINTALVTGNTNVTITGVYAGVTRNATLTVRPPRLVSVTLDPTIIVGGTPSTGTVTLDGPAAAADTPVTLSSNNTAAATVPASVVVPAGQTSASFTVTTKVVTSSATVAITGTRVVSQTATITVTP